MGAPTRARALDIALATFQSELAGVEAMMAMATAEATGSESKSEGKYDTRATEASYLARGQAERVGSLRGLVAWLTDASRRSGDRVALGALVQIVEDDAETWWLMLPDGGGHVLDVDGERVTVVSPQSPVAREVMGLEEGDEAELWLAGRDRILEVQQVR